MRDALVAPRPRAGDAHHGARPCVARLRRAVRLPVGGDRAVVLHRVDLPTADIDILVKTPDAVDAFGAALAPCPCLSAPAWLPAARQYYGSYDVHGVTVEFSTVNIASDEDTRETCGRGPWERYVALPCGPYTVPTWRSSCA